MILDADGSQLEWRVAAELSRDPVMIQEIVDGMDAHGYACTEWMKYPLTKENRTTAKIFNFRMIYGGSAYSYYMDPKMPPFTLKQWQDIVNAFYAKYTGLAAQHDQWMMQVVKDGEIILPSGRKLRPFKQEQGGMKDYSRPQVLNYPVQAYATADLMPLAMAFTDQILIDLGAYKAGNYFICQVHDSMIFDAIDTRWANGIGHVCVYAFRMLPKLVIHLGWQKDFLTPMNGDFAVGESWGTVEEQLVDETLIDRLALRYPTTSFRL